MQASTRARVVRIGGEFLAIVIGILVALGVDTAWDSHRERQREHSYLVALLEEMQLAKAELLSDQQSRSRRLAALDSLDLYYLARTATDESVAEWVVELTGLALFFPPSAVYEDLLASGGVELIRSDDLRRALIDYQQQGTRLRRMEEREQIMVEQEVRPYLLRSFDLYSEAAAAQTVPALASDRQFWNLVSQRRRVLETVVNWANVTDEAIDKVIVAVRASL